jgi:hypothetical protein
MVKKKVSKKTSSKKSKIKKTKTINEKVLVENDSKSVKKNSSEVNSNLKKFFIPSIITIIILAIVYLFFFQNNYAFVVESNGITYYSNEYTPTTFFEEFKQNKTIYISPLANENGFHNLTANAMNLWLVVLTGNNISPVQLIRMESNGELMYCQTNQGDVMVSEQISAEECNAILNNPENAIVLINITGKNEVFMQKNKIIVNAQSESVVGQANFFVLKKGFSNAEEIVLKVNTGISNIS